MNDVIVKVYEYIFAGLLRLFLIKQRQSSSKFTAEFFDKYLNTFFSHGNIYCDDGANNNGDKVLLIFFAINWPMMNTTTETTKPLIFWFEKSNNPTSRQTCHKFSTRIFNDSKHLIKSILINKSSEFHPSALVLAGDYDSIKEVLMNEQINLIKTFILCQNSTRQVYEPFMAESKLTDHIFGLFTTMEDLNDSLEHNLTDSKHDRQLIRFVTGNLESYLWYELLKEISFKIVIEYPKQSVDIANINRQIEYDPLLTLYTHRASIRSLTHRKTSCKKVFYGTVIKKNLLENLESNINNLISFNSFVHLQGHNRIQDARYQAIQSCSRRHDEISVIFELESADQPTFKIIRIFNCNKEINLWIIQLLGTQECVKLSKQFAHTKRANSPFSRWEQAEILFGCILIEMNEMDRAYQYFFQLFIPQYEQLNKIYASACQLWENDKKYIESVECIASEFQDIKAGASSNRTADKGKDEATYLESEIDSTWETPIALQDAKKINDLLAPISYQVDHILFNGKDPKCTKSSSKRRCCLLI